MIFGTPVSGFEKKVKKLFRRRCWHFSNMRSLELKSLASAKRPVGEGRDDICLVGSQSPMADVALRMASTGLPCLGSRTKTRCVPAPFIAGPCRRIGPPSCPKNRNVSAGLGLVRIPDPPGRRSVGGRKPSFSPPPFLRLRSGSCSTHASKTYSNSQLNRLQMLF